MISAVAGEEALVERARALGALLREYAGAAGEYAGAAGEYAGAAGEYAGAAGDADAGVVLLDGPMGAGKTTFTRALAEGLGVARPGRVCSPTFTLCMVHAGAGPRAVTLVHVDLFRLADADDEGMGGGAGFDALDLEEIAAEAMAGEAATGSASRRVLVVEWARKWSRPPEERLEIQLGFVPGAGGGAGSSRRIMAVAAHGTRSTAILAAWSRGFAGSPLL